MRASTRPYECSPGWDCPRVGLGRCPACAERHRSYARSHYQRNKTQYRGYKRKFTLATRYGITMEERSAIFRESDGLCALCYDEPAVHLDHDHETGRIRGALCQPCNLGLGRAERMGLDRIAEYLGVE